MGLLWQVWETCQINLHFDADEVQHVVDDHLASSDTESRVVASPPVICSSVDGHQDRVAMRFERHPNRRRHGSLQRMPGEHDDRVAVQIGSQHGVEFFCELGEDFGCGLDGVGRRHGIDYGPEGPCCQCSRM